MKRSSLPELLQSNAYPGRGIAIGKSPDGKHAVITYFITGRSTDSKNRYLISDQDGIQMQAVDSDKLIDAALLIYKPIRTLDGYTIVTNGDHTDTVYDHLCQQQSFETALRTRTFEPDGPHFTPRISGLVRTTPDCFLYQLSILKSHSGDPCAVLRFFFDYAQPVCGVGHFIHTYRGDAHPLPSFEGEPIAVDINHNCIDQWTQQIWDSLDADNKVSLFTRFIDLTTLETQTRIINRITLPSNHTGAPSNV